MATAKQSRSSEIKSLKERLAKLEADQAADKQKAVDQINALIVDHGIQARELTFGNSPTVTVQKPKKTKKPAVKYRDPLNPKNTWSGRGPQPKWIKEYLASGKSLDDLLVK